MPLWITILLSWKNWGEVEFLERELVTNPKTRLFRKSTTQERDDIPSEGGLAFARSHRSLERGESPLIQKTTSVYLRDVYDQHHPAIDTVETFRDMVSGMLDIYLSQQQGGGGTGRSLFST